MSQLSGKSCFERSCLPSEPQLDLHVNGREFTALMNQMELDDIIIEKMAKAFHENYCIYLKSKGIMSHSSLLDYDKLPENEKEQNRRNVRDIPRKLAIVGYIMVTNRNNEPLVEFRKKEVEILAKDEHKEWVKLKRKDKWRWAEKTDKAKKLHQHLLTWEELPDDVKENDRVMIRAIPHIISDAGFIMFKLD